MTKRLTDHWLLRTLKPHEKYDDVAIARVQFSGYSNLMATCADLIRICASAAEYGPPGSTPFALGREPDIPNILELVLQLLPSHEAELLDRFAEGLYVMMEDGPRNGSEERLLQITDAEFTLRKITLAWPAAG